MWVAAAKPGARLGDIGAAIEAHARQFRYGVVQEFCGHGLGRLFHDAPEVIHAARAAELELLVADAFGEPVEHEQERRAAAEPDRHAVLDEIRCGVGRGPLGDVRVSHAPTVC